MEHELKMETRKKRALITGVTGMDGSYLAELLLNKGYEVYGLVRRSSNMKRERIDHLNGKIKLIYGDLQDSASLRNAIEISEPDEVYNLGGQSHVKISFDIPDYTFDVVGNGTIRLLESIRCVNKDIRYYQASSSEMFGKVAETPQKETTPFHPRSPYAVAKLAAHNATINYRESYGMFCCNGILFNHTGERRGENFVTRKISIGVAKIHKGLEDKIYLGNLEAKRDWGYAKDYVEAMYLMLQHDSPNDYVVSTGQMYSVSEYLTHAFKVIGIDDWTKYIVIDPKFYRPAEVDILLGNSTKIQQTLGWKPSTGFGNIVKRMVENDIKLIEEGKI